MELENVRIISFKTWPDPDTFAAFFITICISHSGWRWLKKKGCKLNIFTEGNFIKKKGDSHSPSIHLIAMKNSDPPRVMGPPSEAKKEIS